MVAWTLAAQVEATNEATGLGHTYGNKGGLVGKFDYRGTSLAFVCSHLAAHEGRKHCDRRNSDAAEIQVWGGQKHHTVHAFMHVVHDSGRSPRH